MFAPNNNFSSLNYAKNIVLCIVYYHIVSYLYICIYTCIAVLLKINYTFMHMHFGFILCTIHGNFFFACTIKLFQNREYIEYITESIFLLRYECILS